MSDDRVLFVTHHNLNSCLCLFGSRGKFLYLRAAGASGGGGQGDTSDTQQTSLSSVMNGQCQTCKRATHSRTRQHNYITCLSPLHRQIYHNIKYSSDLQWNHVGMCMLNSGAIRSPIDERYKNGTMHFFSFLHSYEPLCSEIRVRVLTEVCLP